MTITIGNSNIPGVYISQESSSSGSLNVAAPADVGLVGEADLSVGTAAANEVQTVTTVPQATRLFGPDSPLGRAVADALLNGAFPVYAVATEMTAVTGEDISASASGTLANVPATEIPASITFDLDGTSATPTVVFDDPADYTPDTDSVVYNPVSGDFNIDAAPTSGTVDYSYPDYSTAITALVDAEGDALDFVGAVSEAASVQTAVKTAIDGMVAVKQFAIGVVGEGYLADTSAATNPFDSSRMQVMYASRDVDGRSYLGAYLGVRGRLGIEQSGMRQRFVGVKTPFTALTEADKQNLHEESFLVIEAARRGVRTMNDLTAVADGNLDEAEMRTGFARLVIDYATDIVDAESDRFIGKLHTQSARNNLRDILFGQMNDLKDLNAVIAFTVTVEKINSVKARVTLGIETAAPLENIEVVIVSGEVAASA